MKQLGLTVLLICIPILCQAVPAQFDLAIRTGDGGAAQFSWTKSNKVLSLSGKGVLSPLTNSANSKLRLPIAKNEIIDQLLVQKNDNDILLLIRATDGVDGRGLICRVNWPENSIQWCQTNLDYFINVSADMDSIYIGSSGYIARLNPKNGIFIWKHEGLYKKDHSIQFVCFATENDTTVIFNANAGKKSAVYKQVSLDRLTGRILRISNDGLIDACHY